MGFVNSAHQVSADGAEFTISPVYNQGQTDKSLGYFSVEARNGKTYPLTVNVQNLSNRQISKFEASVIHASTSNGGNIDYTPSKSKMVNKQAPLLPDLVNKKQNKQEFLLMPNESKNITFKVKIPSDGFKGTILGSVYVKKVSSIEKQNKNFGIKNSFAMTVPAIFSKDFSKKITPKLSLSVAKMESYSGVPYVFGRIDNNEPTMFGKIKLNAWVTKKGHADKLYENTSKNLSMAPYSTFKHAIYTSNNILPKGKYTYYAEIASGDKYFHLKKDFTVDSKNRNKVNSTLINAEKGFNWWLWGSLTVFILAIITLISYLIGKKIENNKHSK